ncbi:MAG: ABC transporter substrate-binding protein [Gemmatimonadales bacterium]
MCRAIGSLALLLVACSGASRRGETVILASGADLQSPNPLLTVHPLARQVQRYALLVTLVRYDSALLVTPYYARRWSWSADRQTLTMHLFGGLNWHDGVPTTAPDAAWTLEAARRVETGYPRRAELAELERVAAPDDTTLVLRFRAPQAGIPDVLTDLALLPRHLFSEVPLDRLRGAAWNRRPIGNGPFRFVAYQPNRRWVFEANPAFPPELGGPPRIQRFVVAVVDEPTTKLAALTSGELDFAGINPAHAAFVQRDPRLAVLDYPLLFSYALVFNTRRPPFDRVEARRAVAAAIDRPAIVEGVLFGYGTPATGPIPPELEVPGVSTSAEGRGSAEPPSHLPSSRLSFQLLTVGSGEAALEQMLQAQLGANGIVAEIRQLELSTYLDRVQGRSPDFDAAVFGISGDLGLGHLNQVVSIAGLRAEGRSERLGALILDSLPATFLYHARGVQGMNRRVQGVRMDLRGELVTLTQWTVKREE